METQLGRARQPGPVPGHCPRVHVAEPVPAAGPVLYLGHAHRRAGRARPAGHLQCGHVRC